ncbi:MAG: adenosylmethionine decarboxylase [Candidatus Omnitrophica bacterium]|nr:adenosylmethionine decarboxylase [Candidatus Omnitrophota bacterium]
MEEKQNIFGCHYIVEYIGCDTEKLKWSAPVEEALLESARLSQATIKQHAVHQYEPNGVSGFIFIAESHVSVHTWPESQYVAFDVLTCGEKMDSQVIIDYMRDFFKASKTNVQKILRGF